MLITTELCTTLGEMCAEYSAYISLALITMGSRTGGSQTRELSTTLSELSTTLSELSTTLSELSTTLSELCAEYSAYNSNPRPYFIIV